MPLILMVVFAVLVLLLRALIAPLLLAASVVLSFVSAGRGGAGAPGDRLPNIDPSLPLWGYLFLVTIGVDYTIFLIPERARRSQSSATATESSPAVWPTGERNRNRAETPSRWPHRRYTDNARRRSPHLIVRGGDCGR